MAKYRLEILPTFEEDFNQIVDYITIKVANPSAALNLVDKVYTAIQERLDYPLSLQAFQSKEKRLHPYYVIRVGNYSIFYVVIGQVMEVRRILYSKRNLDFHL